MPICLFYNVDPNCPGAKLAVFTRLVPNCPFYQYQRQIVHFLILLPNCLFAFLVPNCPFLLSWCRIVRCQIVLPPFLTPFFIWIKSSLSNTCFAELDTICLTREEKHWQIQFSTDWSNFPLSLVERGTTECQYFGISKYGKLTRITNTVWLQLVSFLGPLLTSIGDWRLTLIKLKYQNPLRQSW